MAIAAAASTLLVASSGFACGGLFCANNAQVNQAAERIVFAQNDNQTVTAVIEIVYDGEAHSFAWLLPVPKGEIEFGVSSKQVLDGLQQASNPSYQLSAVGAPGCPEPAPPPAPTAGMSGGALDSEPTAVEVIDSGKAGPYDWEQLVVDEQVQNPGEVVIEWLENNGYDVNAFDVATLQPYLLAGMSLVAVRLNTESDTGTIRPVLVTYQGTKPSIPIIPTSIAANDDMGVLVWVLGPHRAVPTNYFSLEINEAMINWFNPGPTYNDVITAAADAAGGQGFVTEQSGPAEDFIDVVYPSTAQERWDELQAGEFESIEEFMLAAERVAAAPFISITNIFGTFRGSFTELFNPRYDGFVEVLSNSEIVPLRDGTTPEQFAACVSCYFQADAEDRGGNYPSTPYDPETDPLNDIDQAAFLAEMERLVTGPLLRTRELFESNATVTRLYTTLSADEMTVDPEFEFNPDLAAYSNVHTAEQVVYCDDETDSEWQVQLPQGMIVEGGGRTWPLTLESDMPVLLRITQMAPASAGLVVEDNAAIIGDRLAALGVGDVGSLMALPIAEPEQPTGAAPENEPTTDDGDTAAPEQDGQGAAEGAGADGSAQQGNDDAEGDRNAEPMVPAPTPAESSDGAGDAVDAGPPTASDAPTRGDAATAPMAELVAGDASSAQSDDGACAVSTPGKPPQGGAATFMLVLGAALARSRRRAR